jgi:hypothetical protein
MKAWLEPASSSGPVATLVVIPAPSPESALEIRLYSNCAIERRKSDGFVNATAMATACGKLWGHYIQTQRAKDYIIALEQVLQATRVVDSRWGGHKGTWIHPRLALDFARWLNSAFAIWMDGWITDSYCEAFLQLPINAHFQRLQVRKHRLKRKSNLYIMALKKTVGKYKVGETANPSRRLVQLGRTSHPPDEQPLFIRVWKGKGKLEKAVHKKLHQYRMGNTEWFEVDLDTLFRLVQEVIDSN